MFEFILNIHQKKIVKDAFALYTGRGISLLLGIISIIIYGNIFANRQIAVISLFEMIIGLFVSFGFSWSTVGIIRFGKEEYNRKNTINYSSSTRIKIILPFVILSILLITITRSSLLNYIGSDDSSIIIYLTIYIILLVFHEHVTSLFTTAEKHVWNALFFIAVSFGKLCILLLLYFGKLNISAEVYIKFTVIWFIGLAFLRIPFIKKEYIFPIEKIDSQDYLRFLKFSIPQIYGFAGIYLIDWVDTYFIRRYCDFYDLGAYQFLYSIFMKFAVFAFILNALFFPKIISWKESNSPKIRQYLEKGPLFLLILILAPILLFIGIYKPIFSIFFAQKYVIAYSSFNILLLTIPFYFMTYLLVPVLNSYDRVFYIQVVNILSALSNLFIDLILIKKVGIIGAAIGTYAAYLIKFSLIIFAVNKMFAIQYKTLAIICTLISLFIMGYFIYNINY